ncbi:hypothetical protein POL68_26045 [Stigmatella sp. ncwal1]|uniref:DUF3592 domain-containing protein n=1 Tax=Stigmatella ashevillensis TaxID=2995309 RepID=A0ABT5DE80_9BACT|nr:hypothetical protein [Stigmatella ashevillena]MDC0711956.1 hypothetical protein [Stigmatella ashevillena]
MTDSASQGIASDGPPAYRPRSLRISAVAFLLLAVPFLVFGGMMLFLKARVELHCDPGGCQLFHLSVLTKTRVELFPVTEIQGASVDRNRSSRAGAEPLYRPVLETTRGKFPLSYRWLDTEADAERTVKVLNRYRANPLAANGRGFILFHDHRRSPLFVGSAFSAVGVGLLGLSLWLALKLRKAPANPRG